MIRGHGGNILGREEDITETTPPKVDVVVAANGRQHWCGNNLVNTGWFNHNLCKQDKMWTIKPYPDIEVGFLKEKIGK